MTVFESYKALFAEDMPRMKRIAAIIVSVINAGLSLMSGLLFPNPICLIILALSVAISASLIFTYRSLYVLIAPVMASLAVWGVSGAIAPSLFSLVSVLPAVALTVLFYRKNSFSTAVTVMSVIFAVSFAAVIGVMYLADPETVPKVTEVRDFLTEKISSLTMNTPAGRVPLYTSDAAASLAEYFVLSLPAFVIIVINTVSFLSAAVFKLLIKAFGFFDRIPDGKWSYKPDVIASVTYLAAYAVSASLIPFASADVIGFAAENVLIALIPAMMIAGEKSLYVFSKERDGLVIFTILSVVLLCLSPSLYLMIISFAGAFSVIIERIRPYISRFSGRDGDGDAE